MLLDVEPAMGWSFLGEDPWVWLWQYSLQVDGGHLSPYYWNLGSRKGYRLLVVYRGSPKAVDLRGQLRIACR